MVRRASRQGLHAWKRTTTSKGVHKARRRLCDTPNASVRKVRQQHDHDVNMFGGIASVMSCRHSFAIRSRGVSRIFDPSSALRHGAEAPTVPEKDEPCELHSVLVIETDGGSDHNCTHWSVKVIVFTLLPSQPAMPSYRTIPGRSFGACRAIMSSANMLYGTAFFVGGDKILTRMNCF